MNITYIAALLENASRPRFNDSPAARATTDKILKQTARTMTKVDRDLKRAGITLAR